MNRDDDIEGASRRDRTGEMFESEPPVAPDSDESAHQPGLSLRSRTGSGSWQPTTVPLVPLKVPPSIMNRNPPTHPSWERPPTPYNYPRIRGQEKRQTAKPLIFAGVAVLLILGAVVALPALLGRGKSAVAPIASSSPLALASSQTFQSATPSQPVGSGSVGTPAPAVSYKQHRVVAGDSIAKIAIKYQIQRWELLLANPQITPPNYTIHLGTYLNIPLPGQLTPPPPVPTDTPVPSAGATVLAP